MLKKNWLLRISLIINLLLCMAIGFVIHRLGGWRYAWHRFLTDETGLYFHRKSLFEQLPARPASIIFAGDSQIEQCEWREIFGDSLPILNRGIACDHLNGLTGRLPEILRHQPAQLIICIGINDLLLGNTLQNIENQYRNVVKTVRNEQPNCHLVLCSVLPVNTNVKNLMVKNEQILELNTSIAGIAREFALPFADVCTPLTDAQGNLSAAYTQDGLHLNGKGYFVWKKVLAAFLDINNQ